MPDIVRLEENGVVKYLETVSTAIVGLDEELSKVRLSSEVVWTGSIYFDKAAELNWNPNKKKIPLFIELVFSRYADGKPVNYGTTSYIQSVAAIVSRDVWIGLHYYENSYIKSVFFDKEKQTVRGSELNGTKTESKLFVLREVILHYVG